MHACSYWGATTAASKRKPVPGTRNLGDTEGRYVLLHVLAHICRGGLYGGLPWLAKKLKRQRCTSHHSRYCSPIDVFFLEARLSAWCGFHGRVAASRPKRESKDSPRNGRIHLSIILKVVVPCYFALRPQAIERVLLGKNDGQCSVGSHG